MSGVADILGISLGLMRQLDSPICIQFSPVVTSGKGGPRSPLGPGHPTSLQEPRDHSLMLPLEILLSLPVTGCGFTPGI